MLHAIRYPLAFACIAFLALVPRAVAADLDGIKLPATLEDAVKLPPVTALKGCFLEFSAAGNFLAVGDRKATGSVGAGCDHQLAANLFMGFGLRADLGEMKAGEGYLKLGINVNQHFALYGFGTWQWTDFAAWDVGQAYLGLGTETSMGASQISAFVEGSTSVSNVGKNTDRNDMVIRIGPRLRF